MIQIHATLKYLKVHSHQWALGRVLPHGADFRRMQELFEQERLPFSGDVAVCGEALVALRAGGAYALHGEFSVHPRYGPQFKVLQAIPYVQADAKQLAAYLQQQFHKIGPVTAEKAVAWYEQQGRLGELRDQVQSGAVELDLTEALQSKAPAVFVSRAGGTMFDQLAVLLSRTYLPAQIRPSAWAGLGNRLGREADPAWDRYATLLQKLSAEEGARLTAPPIRAERLDAAEKEFANNPYAALNHRLRFYGFDEADRVAALVNIARDDPRRLSALGAEAVQRYCRYRGHTYLTLAQFRQAVIDMDPTVQPEAVLEWSRASRMSSLVLDDNRIYTQSLYAAEDSAATALQALLTVPGDPLGEVRGLDARLDALQKRHGITLDDSQREAVTALLASTTRLHTLTAGPGRGKTTVMQMVVAEAERVGLNGLVLTHDEDEETSADGARDERSKSSRFDFAALQKLLVQSGEARRQERVGAFAAPTGKAAKVLGERLQRSVQTIHRLLEPSMSSPDGFKYGVSETLDVDFVVIDEASMLDLELARSVFHAIPEHAHLILLGDPGQLPSVGPGRVLADVLQLPADHHTLHTTHRNTGHILQLIDAIGDGSLQEVSPSEDVRLIVPDGETVEARLLKLVDTYLEAVQAKGFENVCLITPRRMGNAREPGWNVTYLNAAIQARVNPRGERVSGLPFIRVGDRILVRQNVYDKATRDSLVVNGDTGYLLGFTRNDVGVLNSLFLRLDTGEDVLIRGADLDGGADEIERVIDLGYCLTVHAAQGSEYDTVIFAVEASSTFVDRGMVYTAVSRAKRHLVVYGHGDVLVQAARKPPSIRQSYLVPRAGAFSEVADVLYRASRPTSA